MIKIKVTLLTLIMIISANTFSQSIIDIKRDVTNHCKKTYDLFKPIEWSNYELEYKKLGIKGNTIDSSILKTFNKFINGDTSTITINKLNNFEHSFNYAYEVNKDGNPIWLYSNKFGKIIIENNVYNYIISDITSSNKNTITNYYIDTLFFTKHNKNIINKSGDIVKINYYLCEDIIPKKIDYYINCYKIRLVYNALSKGGVVRIYSNTFSANYYLNGKLFTIYEQ